MNKTEAIEKVKRSLAKSEPQILTPKGTTYEAHIAKLSKLLLDSIIDPVRVNVVSTIMEDCDFERYKESEVWGIAIGRGGWLLTISGSEEFALGFGDNPEKIKMHGCSSDDALEEWCL